MRHLLEGGDYFSSLIVKHGVNSRVATKRGAASIRINTVSTSIKSTNFQKLSMFQCVDIFYTHTLESQYKLSMWGWCCTIYEMPNPYNLTTNTIKAY